MLKKSKNLFIAILAVCLLAGMVVNNVEGPPDFAAIKDVKARKKAFFDYLTPMIKDINKERAEERKQLKAIVSDLRAGRVISKKKLTKLTTWTKKYGIKFQKKHLETSAVRLLNRLDQIPASMILAQAAIESAWGTSRFVRLGNNYFGQWCYKKGCGIVPKARNKGAKHEVRKFNNTKKSIYAYFHNINTHSAYKQVRKIRAQERAQGKPLSGMKMVAGLKNYSQRGQAYIDELRSVIRFNKLE